MIPKDAIKIRLIEKRVWRKGLVSLRFEKPNGFHYRVGQFVRLGLNVSVNGVQQYVGRAYSFASLTQDPFLEFFIVEVVQGALSPNLVNLQAGQEVYLEPTLWGQMLPDRIECSQTLWCLSSGTGLAPFIATLRSLGTWRKWPNIVLVHSVRYSEDLAYTAQIQKFSDESCFGGASGRSFTYVPVVTREATQFLSKRIPLLISSGELEDQVGRKLNSSASSVLLCGNPDMVKETRALLKDRGFSAPRRQTAGNLLSENLW